MANIKCDSLRHTTLLNVILQALYWTPRLRNFP